MIESNIHKLTLFERCSDYLEIVVVIILIPLWWPIGKAIEFCHTPRNYYNHE
jgi:hypothetical protein